MLTTNNVSRRSFLKLSGSAAALAGLGLAGCGNNGGGDTAAKSTDATGVEPPEGTVATTPLDQLPLPEKGKAYNNSKKRDDVKDGGTLVLPSGEIGPNWNQISTEGNTAEMLNLWGWYMPSTIMTDATLTKFTPNPDFISNLSSSEDSGKLVVTVDINPAAKFNDGTPITWEAYKAIWTVMNGTNEEYTPASTDGYDKVESVERGANDQQAVFTFSEPVFPYEPIVSQFYHPAAADPTVFNSGWNNNPHAEWGYGPYTVESVSDTQVTFVPNPNWWGDKAKLDSVTYKQMDSQALFNAFKNGEIDTTGQASSGSAEMLSNFSNMEDAYVRRADSLSVVCIEINATRDALKDIAVRKAFCQAVDPATLRSVVFQGVNWDEETPGSLLVPAWQSGYENNMPSDVTDLKDAAARTAAAKKTLEDAGYVAGDDGIYAKDGAKVSFAFTTFGDSNMVKNRAAAIQKMGKDAGINIDIDAKPASEFSKVLTSGDWDICLFGWQSSISSTWNAPQLYASDSSSNFTGTGSAELDAELSKVITVADHAEQMKAMNAVEKKCMESYAFLPLYSGPDVVVVKKGIANLGPSLYESVRAEDVGWEK